MDALQTKLLKLRELREANRLDFKTYIDDLSKMPADVSQRIANRNTEIETLDAEIKTLEKLAADNAANDKALADFAHPNPSGNPAHDDKSAGGGGEDYFKSQHFTEEARRITKSAARYKSLEHFTNDEGGVVKAYRFAKWFAGTILHDMTASPTEFCKRAREYCVKHHIEIKAQSESVNTAGGYLVPTEFSQDIIDLREKYGIFRQFSKVVPMMSDTKQVSRRAGGLTVYNPAEGATITESEKVWGMVQLTAKKFAVLAIYSSELDEDSMINIGDDLAGEIAYAFALKEDQCGFNGDGTSAFFGIIGVRQKLRDVYGTGGGEGLIVGAGNAYSELTLANFNDVIAALPEFAETPNTGWFVSKKFWGSVMQKLALAAGGVTAAEVQDGAPRRSFMGYPVNVSQVMPKTQANSQVCALFGDLAMASKFGDRRMISIASSSEYRFANDQLAIKGTQRVDINIHDVGDAVDAGPVVGLITAAS